MSINTFSVVVLLACGSVAGLSQTPAPEELKFAVVVSRHGVRSPTWTPQRLNQYSVAPWPDWGVEPGQLTKHGRALMTKMGAFYREYFSSKGLSIGSNCQDAGKLYFRADTAQRTMETARGLAEGMMPGCKIEIHSAGVGKRDGLFEGSEGSLTKPDEALAEAALRARLGPDLEAITAAHRQAFELLQQVLVGSGKAKHSLFEEPMSITAGSAGVGLKGPLNLASTLSEDFLLEYTEGMTGQQLGWGRLTKANLLEMMSLHTAYADLSRRTPTLARIRGANLLDGILRSLEQAVAGRPISGAINSPATNLLIISGHDTNLSNLSGMLGLSWLLPGYQADDAPPGGALIFTLWRSVASGQFSLRLQFLAQTPDQMRDATPLSLDKPPAMQSVFVPACSAETDGYPCYLEAFASLARRAGNL